MVSLSSDKMRQALALFQQIRDAICNLEKWNCAVSSEEDYYASPEGMKNLAVSCMLIEAIGESLKRIDKLTDSTLLVERIEIPWKDVIGIRNHIAHGYFDIDGAIVFDAVKHDLKPLAEAVDYFIKRLTDLCD